MDVRYSMYYIPMTSIASSTFTGAYQLLNSTGTTEPCFSYKLINNSNEDVTVSLDGTTDHDFIPAHSACILDVQTNAQPMNNCNLLAKGVHVYVKGIAGTGSVYLVGYMNPSYNPRGL